MYLILVYDVTEKKVVKVLKICREYLNRIQNSVFEGEISESNFKEMKLRIKRVLNLEQDSIIIFKLWKASFKREVIGIEKNELNNII
jgi:CRISPR-associated protein Cas2